MSKINDPSDRSVCFVGDASRFGMKEGIESARFYSDCKILYDSSRKLVSNLINVLLQAKEYCQVDEVSSPCCCRSSEFHKFRDKTSL